MKYPRRVCVRQIELLESGYARKMELHQRQEGLLGKDGDPVVAALRGRLKDLQEQLTQERSQHSVRIQEVAIVFIINNFIFIIIMIQA